MGWCSVTYARAEGTAYELDPGQVAYYRYPKEKYPLDYDVRWQVKAVLDYYTRKLGGFGAHLSWIYHTGFPYTPTFRGEYDERKGRWNWYQGTINSARYPDWSQVDLRLTKDLNYFPWSDKLQTSLNLEVHNLFDHLNLREVNSRTGEPEIQRYTDNTGTPQRITAGLKFRF